MSKKREFETGAMRDTDEGKIDYEGFLSVPVLEVFGRYMHKHRKMADGTMRDSDNWQKGMPQAEYMKSAWRHFVAWWKIHRGLKAEDLLEDAICGVIFNAQGYLHEHLRKRQDRVTRSWVLTQRPYTLEEDGYVRPTDPPTEYPWTRLTADGRDIFRLKERPVGERRSPEDYEAMYKEALDAELKEVMGSQPHTVAGETVASPASWRDEQAAHLDALVEGGTDMGLGDAHSSQIKEAPLSVGDRVRVWAPLCPPHSKTLAPGAFGEVRAVSHVGDLVWVRVDGWSERLFPVRRYVLQVIPDLSKDANR